MFMNVCMLALMAMIPSHSIPISGHPCVATGYTQAWKSLLHQTAIAKNDTRFGLHEGGPIYGLSGPEKEWIGRVTGNVICPGGRGLKGSQGSGALISRNDTIITNAHVVRNKDGSKRDDWGSCYFETQSQPPIRRNIKFFDPGTVFGTRKPETEQDLDYVLLRLEEPILGVEPIPIASNAASIQKNQKLLMVSAYQDDMKVDREVLPNEPVIQQCLARDILPADNRSGVAVNTDCSGTGGASGSILLMRDESNHLVGVGLHQGGNLRTSDHEEYVSAPAKGNRSLGLIFDGPLAKDLQKSFGIQSGL